MNKQAYDAGVQQALAEAGIIKTAVDPTAIMNAFKAFLAKNPQMLAGSAIGAGVGGVGGGLATGGLGGVLGGAALGAGAGGAAGKYSPELLKKLELLQARKGPRIPYEEGPTISV